MRFFLFFLIGAISLTFSQADDSAETTSVFNGKDLSGWKVPDNNIWWLIGDDGVLQVRSGPKEKGSILWTEKSYGDFVFECEFRFVSGRIDSGIHLRNMDQIQIGESGSLKRDMTGSPYIPGKGYPVEAEGVADLLDAKGWNRLKIVVKGAHYTTHLNGKEVMNYKSETAIEKGPVGIQLHGKRDMAIDFRHIKVGER